MAKPQVDAVDTNLRLLARRRPDLDLRGSEITARLFRLREILVATLDRVHARFGLKPRMFLVLGALYRSGPPYKLSPSTLVRALMWTSAGLSQLLDRMQAAGLIRREAHPEDRRALQVAMSPVGEKLIAAVYGAPFGAKPNKQSTRRRQGSSALPAGWVLASIMVEAAPAPCSRTGFHIISISL